MGTLRRGVLNQTDGNNAASLGHEKGLIVAEQIAGIDLIGHIR